MKSSYATNTLRFERSRCTGCGLCAVVCPHGVFGRPGDAVALARPEACMECGACQKNCPAGAISVESGVGCATALMYAALTGREACCGPRDEPCCGPGEEPCGPDRREPDGGRTRALLWGRGGRRSSDR